MVLRVLHLVGSAVDPFYAELSRLYAADCLASTANPALYEFHIAYVTPDRQWCFPEDLTIGAIDRAPSMPLAAAVQVLSDRAIDVALPQMFCLSGMTHYRALLDLLNIPYVGNPPDVMALAADKAKTRAVVSAASVRVPPGELLRPGDRPQIPPPAVIKPVNTDNSLGLALVQESADYEAALSIAFAHADAVLVEQFIALGREVRCGVIEQAGQLVCLPLEEYAMNPVERPIRRYGDKLKRDQTGGLTMVAKDSTLSWIVDPGDPLSDRVQAIAKQCHIALGCRHYSLFDFRIDPEGQPWFLEAGLYCSFAQNSVISAMAKAAGISLDRLLERMLDNLLMSPSI
jgi:D-alanine-D-alanine ligase